MGVSLTSPHLTSPHLTRAMATLILPTSTASSIMTFTTYLILSYLILPEACDGHPDSAGLHCQLGDDVDDEVPDLLEVGLPDRPWTVQQEQDIHVVSGTAWRGEYVRHIHIGCSYSALPMSRGHFPPNNSLKTAIARPLGRDMAAFHEFEVWPFCLRIYCPVCNILLYRAAIYRESIVIRIVTGHFLGYF